MDSFVKITQRVFNKVKIIKSILIVGIFICIFSHRLYFPYMNLVHSGIGLAEGNLEKLFIRFIPILIALFVISYFYFLVRNKIKLVTIKTLLLLTILSQFFLLFRQNPTAEGYNMILFSFLAFVLARVDCQRIAKSNVVAYFLYACFAWLLIIAINEIVQIRIDYREGEWKDIIFDMKGVMIALFLSIPWFWKGYGFKSK
ncbi:hypothetical protein ACFL0P_00535 [Candidatus Omnitrophota bacterium]